MKIDVYVTVKEDVLDPQGKAIQRVLASHGHRNVGSVRVGKYIELEMAESDEATALEQARQMAETLLANSVVEDYRVQLGKDRHR